MNTVVHVLGADDCAQVHERSLDLLLKTGVRVMSERARALLADVGAEVVSDGAQVRFPRRLIEDALKSVPRELTLGSRRGDPPMRMNAGECRLGADGGAVMVFDWERGDLRPGTFEDWLAATRLIDYIDEIEVYWNMVEGGFKDTASGFIEYWTQLARNCSKHIQDSVATPEKARLLLEILDVVYGGRDYVQAMRPFSYILCPMSPLVIDSLYTDAYLETTRWNLPVAIMPMPLMGATSPASLISTLLVANADFLATLCLVQAASPGSGVLYAALPAAVEPRMWRYTGGGVENSLLGAAAIEMGRFYGLPVEAGAGGTDHFMPGSQASYERGINWVLPTIAWPDVLVGPGLLGGSTILSLEQMLIDVEIFRRCKRLRQGIPTEHADWLEEVLAREGPGGSFVAQKSTLEALRDGTFYLSNQGYHGTHERWKAEGMPTTEDAVHDLVQAVLKKHEPQPLDPAIDRELRALAERAKSADR